MGSVCARPENDLPFDKDGASYTVVFTKGTTVFLYFSHDATEWGTLKVQASAGELAKLGVKKDDSLEELDGVSVADKPSDEVKEALKVAVAKQDVKAKFFRPGATQVELDLEFAKPTPKPTSAPLSVSKASATKQPQEKHRTAGAGGVGSAATKTKDALADNMKALDERGEAIAELEQQTDELADGAGSLAGKFAQMRKKAEGR